MALDRNIIFAAAAAGVVVLGAGGAYYWKSHNDIRHVDFRNGPVEIFNTACADPDLTSAAVTTIPLHDGSYQLGKYQFELVGDVKYGDVSGQTSQDSGERAVFVGSCNAGGATSQVLFVYGLQDGKLTRLATADLSNNGSGVVQSYSIGNGAIQIHENQGTPPQLVTVSYALLGGQLQNVGGSGGGGTTNTQMADNASNPTTGADDSDTDTSGDDKISFQYFHDQLSPYGQWVDNGRWGEVWRPNSESADFRPYRDGHWENTDEYGMTWVANTDWGDIVDHYGRWAYDPENRWVWVPDYTWAPSWVVWRAGEGYVGWMPMPPGDYEGDGDYADAWDSWYGYRDWYAGMAAEQFYDLWSFVPVADLLAASIDDYFVAPAVYEGFIGRIPGWTRYGVFRGHVVDRSFDRHRFEAAFHRRLPVTHARNIMHHHVPKTSAHGGTRIAAREHQAGHGIHGGMHAGAGHRGPGAPIETASGFKHNGLVHRPGLSHVAHGYGHGTGLGRTAGFSHTSRHGFARSGTGFSHSSRGFSRSGGGGFARSGGGFSHQGFSRTGSYARSGSGGFARSGAGGGFARSGAGGGGFARSGFGGQSGFARSGGFGGGNRGFSGGGFNGGNRGFSGSATRSFGGGGNAFGSQRAAAPHFSGGNSGGGGSRRHH